MKCFLDTEFVEKPNTIDLISTGINTIDLISIGIKCEDGRTFYAENMNFDENLATEWVRANVLPNLKWHGQPKHAFTKPSLVFSGSVEVYGSLIDIRWEILDFIGQDTPEFWGYYSAYDWVAFCWLFGAMVDLPKGWPMYCRDLKQLADMQIPHKPHFPKPENEHNALADAIWNEKYYYYLMK